MSAQHDHPGHPGCISAGNPWPDQTKMEWDIHVRLLFILYDYCKQTIHHFLMHGIQRLNTTVYTWGRLSCCSLAPTTRIWHTFHTKLSIANDLHNCFQMNLRFLNGGVLRNLNMYSSQTLYPVCSATCLSDAQWEVSQQAGYLSNSQYRHSNTLRPWVSLKGVIGGLKAISIPYGPGGLIEFFHFGSTFLFFLGFFIVLISPANINFLSQKKSGYIKLNQSSFWVYV